jgi:glycosyltransferase involved in cell wall biosynthesis
MHILMIAPEPFFEPRGTPFSEFHRIRALTTLGHTVDLVTYPFGHDVTLPGLRIFRAGRPPGITRVGIGPSWTKVPLNILLTFTALRRALSGRYDAVHSHEEGGAIGVILAWLLGVPHLYDMHSSLPQQVSNFGYRGMPGLETLFGWLERLMIHGSKVVIVICPDLADTARRVRGDVPTVLIENAPGSGDAPTAGTGQAVREALGLSPATPVAVYTGTFEHYQGLDLLYAAMVIVRARRPDARLVLVGGDEAQVTKARQQVTSLGIADCVVFTGQRPAGKFRHISTPPRCSCLRGRRERTRRSRSTSTCGRLVRSSPPICGPTRRSCRRTRRCWPPPHPRRWPRPFSTCSTIPTKRRPSANAPRLWPPPSTAKRRT